MKKLFIFLISLFLFTCNLQAQDLIVTSSGDSINCKITKTTKEYTYFTFKHNTEIRNTLLPVNRIAAQHKNYFAVSELPENYISKEIFPRFRLAVDGGWQYRTAKLADGMNSEWEEHYRELKSGFHYDIQAAYFFAENHGVELMFSQQLFSNSMSDAYGIDMHGRFIGSGELKEKIAFNYIGANYLLRLFNSKNKNTWIFSIGLGYLGYNDKIFFNNVENLKLTAGTIGTNISIGYDIGLSQNFALGFKASLMGGNFRNYKQTQNGRTTNETLPDKTLEGLNTIKLSVGLRFNK